MTALLHIITAALLLAWLCTAAAWAAAGVAVASWGRLPLWLGALLGAALPLFGVLVVSAVALGRRRRADRPAAATVFSEPGRLADAGYAGGAMATGPLRPNPFTTSPSPSPLFGPAGFAASASDDLPNPFGLSIQPAPLELPPPAAGNGWRQLVHLRRSLYAVLALVISVALLLTLLVGNWVRVTVSEGFSFQLSAWDIGLGQMLVISVIEFAVFAVVVWRWRTRWLGVLAVFAGTWWFLLWAVSCLVGGGMHDLTRDTRAVRELRSAHLAAGPVWTGMLVLSVLMIGWGVAQLAVAHLDATGRGRESHG